MSRDEYSLLSAVAAGDQSAFSEFYDLHADRVYRYCLARLGVSDMAADACQETWVAVWQGARQFAGEGRPLAWLFGVAQRKVQDAWRRAGRLTTPADAPVPEGAHDPTEATVARMDLTASIARLPPAQQETLLLSYYAGLSCQEIARLTNVPEGTVKSRLYNARQALAQIIGR